LRKPRRRFQKQRRAEKRWAAAWFSGDRTRDRELADAGIYDKYNCDLMPKTATYKANEIIVVLGGIHFYANE
jgi:hypothetical protein